MSRGYFWILYVHILAASLYTGAAAFVSIFLPILRRRLEPGEFAGEVAAVIRFYHPFILVCMGALILTGAWYLTGLKTAMGERFVLIFVPLGLKLATVFFMVMAMSFQFFALGLRLTRGTGPAGNGRPLAAGIEERLAVIGALEKTNLANLLLGLLAIFFGLVLNKGF